MEDELVVEGRIFPVYNTTEVRRIDIFNRSDFTSKYGLFFRTLFEYDAIICIPSRDVKNAIAKIKGPFLLSFQNNDKHPWDVFDGRYKLEENENLEILRHEKQKICV